MPPHYSPTYYTQVQKALNYWEEGGNGKLEYTPVFEIVDSEKADIRIRWVENLQKDQGAPPGVAGSTIPLIVNGRFVHVDITLGVGNYQWMEWVPYSDTAMLAITEHELGHALGLDHSNDKQDIMYPTNEQIDNTNRLYSWQIRFPFTYSGLHSSCNYCLPLCKLHIKTCYKISTINKYD